MRYTKTSIILFMFCAACLTKRFTEKMELPPQYSKIATVKLIDSLGSITLSMPNRYDTFIQWTNHSDCGKPCDREEYRFQPKNLRLTLETGFMWLGEPHDSIERFTILHAGYFPFHDNIDTNIIFVLHPHIREYISSQDKIAEDTVEKIYDRYFQ